MRTLREVIQDAHDRHAAVGHFNVSDSNQLKAVAAAARELEVPVMVGVSEGERKWFGVPQIAAMVWTLKDAGQEIYLNADHTKTLQGIAEAIEYGFDEVLFDGSSLSIEENIAEAKQAVRMAGESGRDVLVEGELGYIGSGSTLLDKIPEGAGLDKTTPELAERFVRESGIDLLAPSVGNIHGMLKDASHFKHLDIERIRGISAATRVPLVLHGGSGTGEHDFRAAIHAGCAVVHINTEIRVAYRRGLEAGLAETEEVNPSKYLQYGTDAMQKVVFEKLQLFAGLTA
jgi:fructose-bisphosphate aldolase class II